MLSILIPTYNYNAFPLVSAIYRQIAKTNVAFEILCLDDASTVIFAENDQINTLPNCRYELLQNNIGRSKIRNLLAKKAAFDWMLFLDADVLPKSDDFMATYLPYLDEEVKIVNGGLLYQNDKPEKSKLLRWVYGKNREALPYTKREEKRYLSFLTLNFIIHKKVFEKAIFNESIPNLRHEDTLFSYNLMQKNIKVVHIDNPIYHLGLDTFSDMIKKENESLFVLKYLIDTRLVAPDYLRISKLFFKMKKWKLVVPFAFFYKMMRTIFIQNLSGNLPSLFIFDLYRLGYLCSIENKE
jgi:hypothetical protein